MTPEGPSGVPGLSRPGAVTRQQGLPDRKNRRDRDDRKRRKRKKRPVETPEELQDEIDPQARQDENEDDDHQLDVLV